ncbi:MAG: hypothetical protein AB1894_17080 [Chloroflexota bacterium]
MWFFLQSQSSCQIRPPIQRDAGPFIGAGLRHCSKSIFNCHQLLNDPFNAYLLMSSWSFPGGKCTLPQAIKQMQASTVDKGKLCSAHLLRFGHFYYREFRCKNQEAFEFVG